MRDLHATHKLGPGQSFFNAMEEGDLAWRGQLNPERQLFLGGIHHLSHEEGSLGAFIVDDEEEGSVVLDFRGN